MVPKLQLLNNVPYSPPLLNEQYIALERLESVYKASNLVANICVHATPDAKQPIAIIIPHEVNLHHTLGASGQDHESSSLAQLCHDDKVKAVVLKDLNGIAKKNGFKPMELLEAVILTPDEWTPESGLVTAAQKIQRSKIAKAFGEEIKVLPHSRFAA
jgi:long-chain acyl-CoA synthetase